MVDYLKQQYQCRTVSGIQENKEVNKLKQQRDNYRKLGTNVGKKLVKKMTKKIYRIDQQLRSKARGKTKKHKI
jgi:hypothetical protein